MSITREWKMKSLNYSWGKLMAKCVNWKLILINEITYAQRERSARKNVSQSIIERREKFVIGIAAYVHIIIVISIDFARNGNAKKSAAYIVCERPISLTRLRERTWVQKCCELSRIECYNSVVCNFEIASWKNKHLKVNSLSVNVCGCHNGAGRNRTAAAQ
jgi:hypothetical protein